MLEHLLGDGVPRGAKKLLAKGEPAVAEVVGIRVSSRGSETETDRWEYALRLQAEGRAPSPLGVRQQLTPHRERAHLGALVVVRHDGERAVIDWTASMARWGAGEVSKSAADWSMVDPPEEASIDDRRHVGRSRAGRGDVERLELIGAERSTALGGILAAWDLQVQAGGGSYELKRVNVPAYAVHLLVPSCTLYGVLDKGRMHIEWVRSAVEAATRGRPTGFDFDSLLPPIPEADGTIEDLDAWMEEFEKFKK